MKIALLGYGRMGKAIEKIALDRGHSVVIKVDEHTGPYNIKEAEVAIDFSIPSTAEQNIRNCIENGVPVISGTTGWLEAYNDVVKLCNDKKGAFIYASNFSLGVNVFFELNTYLAKMMSNLKDYSISMEEIHHTEKLDAPSGTAITLAEGVIQNSSKTSWALDASNNSDAISIAAKRIPNVPGTHTVSYQSDIDTIDIIHTAHSRQGFALGAVVAAEWLVGKAGVFSMKDVLGLK